eukprot:TRINITY_DN5698_c0_g1_i1.p1 TRINITY_DN5698_c0_g1~~TRINITY_DN5698_c0_g1_i1.p1  ORF type:complete len:557 (+),score=169.79 TRINITY_DN5698_c0_g1_i1:60-1673(+)
MTDAVGPNRQAAAHYKRNVYLVGASFFLVFTAFSTIQNLEASIVGGHCSDCSEVCWAGSDSCVDKGVTSKPAASSTTCSWTDAFGTQYCGKYGGTCESTCPNSPDGQGSNVTVQYKNGTTANEEFHACGGGSNVGSIAIAVLYGVFTLCCLFGPYVVESLRAKWSIVIGLFLFTLFCLANFIVAMYPTSTTLQWGLLVPASAMVGVAASFLWTAQGAYVTISANKYAEKMQLEPKAALGEFNGIFFGMFQCTQISGNLAAGMLLSLAGWSTTSLMVFYLCFAAAGTAFALFFLEDVRDDVDSEGHQSDTESVISVARSPTQIIFGMTELWKDRRLMLLIPAIMYSGIEMGFIWGTYTSNWVKSSVGTANIGYVMAAFGACDVLGSVAFGRLSDVVGRLPVVTLGAACQLAVVIVLKLIDVGGCDHRWAILMTCAGLWGLGDAVWNTQLCSVLGDNFSSRKEDAFANFKLWQSVAVATMFALGYNPTLLDEDANLNIVLGTLIAGYTFYFIACFTVGLEGAADDEEKKRLLGKKAPEV